MIVDIPGVGQVEFPDTMSDAEVSAAAARLHEQATASTGPGGMGTGLLRQFGQGASFGFIDELQGAANAAIMKAQGYREPFSELYQRQRDAAREEMGAFAQQNPYLSGAAQLVGGGVTGIGAGGLAAGTRAGQAISGAMRAMTPAARAAAAVPLGAAGGAVGGALSGAGEAPSLEAVPSQAGTGALVGGLIGGALGPVGEVAATGLQRAGGAIKRRLMPEPDVRARQRVQEAIARQGMSPQDVAGRMEALGPGATVADTGEQTLAMLDALATQPGATGPLAGRQLAQRSRQQIGELTEAIGEGRAAEAIDASKVFRSQQASPIYQQAFEEGIDHTDVLEDLFSRPTVQRAWNAAKRRGQDISGIDPTRYGDVRPSLEGWQAVKESIDDRISSLMRTGKTKEAGEIRESILEPLLAELDAASPIYAEARRMWAGSKAFDDAVAAGRRFVNEPSGATERALRELTDADREGYKIGAVQAIQDMLERQGWTHDATRRFRTPGMERKLRALLGPTEFVDFMNRLEASRVKQATFSAVGRGSATARRQAQQTDAGMAQALLEAGADVLAGDTVRGAATRGLARGVRNLPIGGTPEAARDIAGQMLLSTDPATLARIYQPPPQIVAPGAGLLPFAAGVPVGIGAGLLATGNQ